MNVSDRVDDPSAAGVERYVGLEHIDPGSMTITRWGSPDQVEAQKLRFQPGDVIFGRRRAYQRKVARADFEGICSAHALVLRARPGVVDPDFLPVFLSSDVFLARAIAISVGSLSPTVNWGTLATQEFDLPPIEDQRMLANLLWSIERSLSAATGELAAQDTLIRFRDDSLVWGDWPQHLLGDLLESCDYGTSAWCSEDFGPGAVPVLRIPNVVRGSLSLEDLKYLADTTRDSSEYSVSSGDLLVVRTNGNPEYVGQAASVPKLEREMLFASYLLRLRTLDAVLLPQFLALIWRTATFRRRMRPYIRSSAGNYNLSASSIRALPVPVPSIADQERLLALADLTSAARAACQTEVEALRTLRRCFVARLLEGGPE